MLLRVARFATAVDGADDAARRARALLDTIARSEGLVWSSVRSEVSGPSVVVVVASVWRDRRSMDRALGLGPDGSARVEDAAGLRRPEDVRILPISGAAGRGRVGTSGIARTGRRRPLLPRDRDLLRLLCGGATLAQAAAELGVAVGTAKNRRHEVFEKLGVHDLRGACIAAGTELEAGPDRLRA